MRSSYGDFDAASSLPELTHTRDRGAHSGDNYLVQFQRPISVAQRADVLSTGAQIIRYFPDNAYVVRATPAQVQSLGALGGIQTVTLFPDLLRMSPALVGSTTNPSLDSSSAVPIPVLVEYATAAAGSGVVAAVQSAGGQVLKGPRPGGVGRVLTALLTPAHMAALLNDLDVLSIEPLGPMLPQNDVEYGILQAGEPNTAPLWTQSLDGQGQIIGIADGALSTQSCRFSPVINYEKILAYVQQSNTTFTDPNMYLHGTHVAGIALGDVNNNHVFDDQDGMAPGAQLYFQALGDNFNGLPADLSDLFSPALTAGAYIHTNSYGGNPVYDAEARSLDAFVWDNPTFLVVFAAGNVGPAQSTITDPGTAKNVLTVGSMDNPNDVSEFSSHGPAPDGRIKPTLIATGGNVISAAWSTNLNASPPNTAPVGCNTVMLSGTSQAAPNLAGGAALVRQYFVDGFYPSGEANTKNIDTLPSAALLRATLIASGVNMNGNNTGGAFPAMGQGFGRAQLDSALYFAGTGTQRLYVQDVLTGIAAGQTQIYTVHTQYNTPVKVVLAWSDAPPAANATTQLVNNLDLTVIDPSGNTYRGNVMADGNSVVNGTADAVNVEEMVYVTQPVAMGTWQIQVHGTNVPTGPQPYALVALGSFPATDLTALANNTSPGGSSGSGGAGSGASGASGSGAGSDEGPGSGTYGGVSNKSSGCNAIAANDALLVLLMALAYFLPKPPRRKRIRVRRQPR